MSGGETSRAATKRSIKQQMAAEAAAIASSLQENRGVRFSEPRTATPEPYEAMNQNSNTKGKGIVNGSGNGKGKCKENRGAHISEPPMSFQDTSETDEVMSNQNSNPKGNGKGNGNGNGKAKCQRKTTGPKTVTFNRLGQPVGNNAAPLAHFLSKAAKGLVPLTVRSWFGNSLSADFKDLIWNHVKRYYIIDDCHRKLCFRKMAKYWRGYKSEMIALFEEGVKSASVEVVARNTRPANVHSLDLWTKFVKFCLSPNEVERRKRYKELRQAQTLQYHKSKKSLACLEYEMIESSDDPNEITRVDVWLAGFSKKKKDGDEDIEEQEVVRKVKEKMAQQPDRSQWTINDDPVSQVLGPERRGRVRGYGFGATPSLLIGNGLADGRINSLEKELQDLKMLVKDLLSQRDTGDNSGENNNVAVPPVHFVNTNDNTSPRQKRKKVPCVLNSSEQVKKKAPQIQQLHLLSWYDTEKIVAIGELASKDPDDKVHCIRLGPNCWKVWVREVIEDIALARPTEEFNTLSEAKGSTVAWPSRCIKLL